MVQVPGLDAASALQVGWSMCTVLFKSSSHSPSFFAHASPVNSGSTVHGNPTGTARWNLAIPHTTPTLINPPHPGTPDTSPPTYTHTRSEIT